MADLASRIQLLLEKRMCAEDVTQSGVHVSFSNGVAGKSKKAVKSEKECDGSSGKAYNLVGNAVQCV